MVDIYETKGFDNFICSVVKTYVIPDILNYEGKLDDTRLKLVLFLPIVPCNERGYWQIFEFIQTVHYVCQTNHVG